jgi:hypothetical protein
LLFSFENPHRQYLRCRRNKRNTLNALRFEARCEENLLALREGLVTRTYAPSRSVCFFAPGPKLRKIFAADFCDRVVHYVLVDHLERIWEPLFIHDSYACRPGKGAHAAVRRLQTFIRQASANGTRRAWYLQLDIRNYFLSIDCDILFAQVAARLAGDGDALWLAKVLIYHDCTELYLYRGPRGAYDRVPPHKTLFGAPKTKGLPIGNLNSQFFANVYLNGFDHFVKHTLKYRHYLRYCDDFVLLSPERGQLIDWHERIAAYLRDALALEVNTKRTRLRPVSDGIDFVGYFVRREYLLVRRRVVSQLKVKLREYQTDLVREGRNVRCCRFDGERLDTLFATLCSYLSHSRMASTYTLWRTLWERHPWLGQYFDFDPDARKLVRTYKAPRGFRRAVQQYRYYRWRFRGDVLLFQVGRFFEFYDTRDISIAQLLGLAPLGDNSRDARYGFPVRLVGRCLRTLLRTGRSVALVLESKRYLTGVQVRLPACRFELVEKGRCSGISDSPG